MTSKLRLHQSYSITVLPYSIVTTWAEKQNVPTTRQCSSMFIRVAKKSL